MSYRESIRVDYPLDVEKYLQVLQAEFRARANPHELGSYLTGDPPLPFYRPRLIEKQLSIVSFNYLPLPLNCALALVSHPELVPPTAMIAWTAEQDLIFRGTLWALERQLR